MSRALAKLLGKPEKEITSSIAQLEALSGYPSEDVRLLADNKQKQRLKIAQLGLDADDTTDEELHYALMSRFERDSLVIDKAMGVGEATGFDERLNKAIQLVGHCADVHDKWFLKNAVARKLLLQNPPKKTAKRLHYRSAPSLIKREDIGAIYLLAEEFESSTWRKANAKQIAKQSPSSYELRPIRIVKLPAKITSLKTSDEAYTLSDVRLGVLAMRPSARLEKVSVLCLTLLLLSGLEEMDPEDYSESLYELSPSLRWWADAGCLISDGNRPVSFNLKDVAINQLHYHRLNDSSLKYGAQTLWRQLTMRYKQLATGLSEDVAEIEQGISADHTESKLPMADELANEYITVE